MKNKWIPIVILLLVLGAALYILTKMNANESAQQATTQTTTGEAAPAAPSTENAAPTTQTNKVPTNMNPDLTPDAQGLSKATAVIQTSKGVIKFKFYPKDAPDTTKRLVELINSGFYNGLNFHRVIPGFVAQGGDPKGDGTGGSGQKLKAEFNRRRHVDGTLAMARAADPNSADSQFYITLGSHPHLDDKYTVFGQVVEGLGVAHQLQVGDKIESFTIE